MHLRSACGLRRRSQMPAVRVSRRRRPLRTETIVAPSGVCGVHSLPNAGQSCGFFRPLRTCPLMHSGRFLRLDVVHLEEPLGVVIAVLASGA